MGRTAVRRYSVYNGKDEMPIVIYGTAQECAKAMGITPGSFYKYVYRITNGLWKPIKWLVFVDE